MRRLMLIEFAALVGLTVLAALGFGRVFAGHGYVVPVVGAVVVPVSITVLGMFRRATAAATLLWSSAAFVLFTTYAALGDTAPNVYPTVTTARQLASGLTGGWAELLTISLPAPVSPGPLVAVLGLVWAASAIGAEFAHRSRSAVAPVVPAVTAYLASLGFGASQPRSPVLLPLAVTAALLFVMLVHTNRWAVLEPAGLRADGDTDGEPERDRPLSVDTSATRWILLGTPLIAVAVGAAWLVVPRLPGRASAFDPRSLREQRVEVELAASPLDGLKAELGLAPQDPPVRFTLRTASPSDAQAVPRLRLAVLDRFDGATWSSSAVFTKAGPTLPPGTSPGIRTQRVTQQIAITSAAGGPWLPAADRPVSIEVTGGALRVGVDADSGVLISTGGDPSGASYTVVSDVARPSADQLAALTMPDPGTDTSHLTDVANMPAELRELAQRLTEPEGGAAATPYARLLQLQNALANGYGYREDVPSGSSYGRLVRFLTVERAGYAEQFAAAFATMARSLGFPTRLAYGYLTTETDPDTDTAVNLTDLTSRQAHVWPEVLLGDGVWIAFEPTPPRQTSAPPQPSDPVADTLGGGGVVTGEASTDIVSSTGGGASERPEETSPPLSTPVLAAATVVLVVLMLLGSLVAMKRIRRHRRRNRPSTTHQVLGAWAEVIDRLLELGVLVDRSMTAKEVVRASAPLVSERATDRLAVMVPIVTVALYAPEPPSPEGAAEMWAHADAFQREVLDDQQWYRGTVALLNPRPLLTGLSRR